MAKKKAWVAPSFPKAVASGQWVISKEVEGGEALNLTEDLAISDTEKAATGEGVDESELIDSNDESDPQLVEENVVQAFSTSNELEDIMDEGSDIVLDDLPIDSLVVADETKSLSIEKAQELIPEEALKLLKEKFNGHIENCRPIHDRDRLV